MNFGSFTSGGTGGVTSTVMLVMLAVFAYFIVNGALWGMIGGFKRATFRLITIIVGLTLALLLTPVFSRMMVGMPIPGVGKTAGGFLDELIKNNSTGAEIAEQASGFMNVLLGFAVVLLNFIMFFALYIAFKFISWIVYAVFRGKVYKRDKVTKEPKKHWLGGLGIGCVTGFVCFAFFFIPFTGVMQAYNEIATSPSTFGGYNAAKRNEMVRASAEREAGAKRVSAHDLDNMDGDWLGDDEKGNDEKGGMAENLAKVQTNIIDVNSKIQSSAFGKITKIVQVQNFGKMGLKYLTNVPNTKINLRNDIVAIGKVANGGIAVAVELTDGSGEANLGQKIGNWSDAEYTVLQNLVEEIFKIGFIKVSFDYMTGTDENDGLLGVVRDKDMLGGAMDGVPGAEGDPEFKSAGYSAIIEIGKYDKVRHDLLSLIEMAKILAAKDANNRAMYQYIGDVFKNFQNPDELQSAVVRLNQQFDKQMAGTSKLNHLMDTFFGFNLVRAIFTGQDLATLYQAPLANVIYDNDDDRAANKGNLAINGPENAAQWAGISTQASATFREIVDIMYPISYLIYGAEGDLIDRLGDKTKVDPDKIAAVLARLTNGTNAKFVRTIILKYIPYNEADDSPVQVMLKSVYDYLSPNADGTYTDIPWADLLNTMQSAVRLYNIISDVFSDINNLNFDDLSMADVQKVFDAMKDLLETAMSSPAIADMLTDTVSGILEQADVDMGDIGTMLDELLGNGGTIDDLIASATTDGNETYAAYLQGIADFLGESSGDYGTRLDFLKQMFGLSA